jgi:hypothetical protein
MITYTVAKLSCSVAHKSDQVHLSGKNRGKLFVTIGCNQNANVKLTGKLKDAKQSFGLGPATRTVTAGSNVMLTLQLPTAALEALKKGAPESVKLTLTGSNTYGSSKATATINRLHGVT